MTKLSNSEAAYSISIRYLKVTGIDTRSPEGEYIMTLAEKLRKEGEIRGEIRGKLQGEISGKLEGLKDAIELGMILKFPDQVNSVMAEVKKNQ